MGAWVRGCVGAWEGGGAAFCAGCGLPLELLSPTVFLVPALQVCTAEGDVREGNTLYADATPVLRTLSGDVPATAGSVQYVACLQVLSCSVCPGLASRA